MFDCHAARHNNMVCRLHASKWETHLNEGGENKEVKMVEEPFLKKMVAFVESQPNGVEFDRIDDCFHLLQNHTAEINRSDDFDRMYVGENATVKPLFRKENGRYFTLQSSGDGNKVGRNYTDGEIKIIGRTVFTSVIIGAMIILPIHAKAYQTEIVNGIEWKYENAGSGCKIYGDGNTVYNTPKTTAIPQGTVGDIVVPSTLGGRQVTSIMNFAFANCTKITSVIIPDSVTTVGQSAFWMCSNLEKVVFGKGMTSIGASALTVMDWRSSTSKSKLKTIVIRGRYFEGYNGATSVILSSEVVSVYVSTQWTLPKYWFGRDVQYYDPIPAIGSAVAKNLYEALYDAEDERLKSLITTEEQYNNFRSWANGVVGTSDMAQRQTVKDSSFAWLSYALDADSLITKAPAQGEVSIEQFTPNEDEAKAFDLAVAIDGISVGANATAVNLAEVFTIEGSTSPNGTYSSDDVEVSFGTPENGKVKCTARAKDTTKTSFFMKVKMNP